jgi:hypothetical protein
MGKDCELKEAHGWFVTRRPSLPSDAGTDCLYVTSDTKARNKQIRHISLNYWVPRFSQQYDLNQYIDAVHFCNTMLTVHGLHILMKYILAMAEFKGNRNMITNLDDLALFEMLTASVSV